MISTFSTYLNESVELHFEIELNFLQKRNYFFLHTLINEIAIGGFILKKKAQYTYNKYMVVQ